MAPNTGAGVYDSKLVWRPFKTDLTNAAISR
jgi:hypothetical protein